MPALGYSYRRLVNLLGAERVARGGMERLIHSHDFAAVPKPGYLNFGLVPDFVVLPKTPEEVSRIVQYSVESELPIVPRGGATGFYGGGVPCRGGILVDFRQMRRIAKPDAARWAVPALSAEPRPRIDGRRLPELRDRRGRLVQVRERAGEPGERRPRS